MFIPPGQMFVKYFVKQSICPAPTVILSAAKSEFWTPMESIGLRKSENLALPPWNPAPLRTSTIPSVFWLDESGASSLVSCQVSFAGGGDIGFDVCVPCLALQPLALECSRH